MVRSRRSQIPLRWEQYTAMGDRIANTPFLPCKTPLRRELCRKLRSAESRFTVERMMVAATQKDCRVGMVIDLCDTDRYVERNAYVDWGMQHVKIYAPGNRLPHESSIEAFFNATDAFRRMYNDRRTTDMVICVLSTHGVNRVGYFICRYLIEKLAWGAKSAVRFFEDARGYTIERRALRAILLDSVTPSVVNWKRPRGRQDSLNAEAKKIMESDYYSFVPLSEEPEMPTDFDEGSQTLSEDDAFNTEIECALTV